MEIKGLNNTIQSLPAGGFVEFEIKVLLSNKDSYKALYRTICEICENKTLIQTINIIKDNINRELHFIQGEQKKDLNRTYSKKRVHTSIINTSKDLTLKSSLSIEQDIVGIIISNPELARAKHRVSFIILNEWRLDFTFVISTDRVNAENLKSIRDRLFKKTMEPWRDADKIEVEVEYIKDARELKMEDIDNLLDYLNNDILCKPGKNNEVILEMLNNLLEPGGSRIKTLKELLPKPKEMNKKMYSSEVAVNIDNFWLTDKADGLRSLLIIQNGIIGVINSSEPYIKLGECEYENIIIECEKIDTSLYAFDVLIVGDFVDRLALLQAHISDINDLLPKPWQVICKSFVKLNSDNYGRQINDFYETAKKNTLYTIDGLIFTSSTNSYMETKHYKWKPIEYTTIDFMSIKCPNNLLGIMPYEKKDNMTLYFLYTGVHYSIYKKIKHIYVNNKLPVRQSNTYKPMLFSTSDNPYAFLYWSDNDELDNKIIELSRIDNEWTLHKIRHDRLADMYKGVYYGNNFKVAELIWWNFRNPLTLNYICSSNADNELYFKKSSDEHKQIRSHNNNIKRILLNKFIQDYNKEWVIDLGCGHGQDMFKYIDSGIKNMLLLDANDNNLCEVVNRKQNWLTTNKSVSTPVGIYVHKVDLTLPAPDVINSIHSSKIPIQQSSTYLVVCNFAIHYLLGSIKRLNNTLDIVRTLLTSGGKFVVVCLDGKAVYDLLENCDGVWEPNDKYKIRSLYKKKAFSQSLEIEILLPFSNGELYREHLVDIKTLIDKCDKKRLSLVVSGSFYDYVEDGSNFDETDLMYLKMVKYCVFKKL